METGYYFWEEIYIGLDACGTISSLSIWWAYIYNQISTLLIGDTSKKERLAPVR